MGLIYSSADSSQLISALRNNIQSAKETTNQLKSGSQRIVSAVDGRTLSGAAYTAGKGLFNELIIPTISRVTGAFDQLEQELQTFQSADNVIQGEGSYLDEDIIKRQIEVKRAQRSSALTSVFTLGNQITITTTPEMTFYIRNSQRELNSFADRLLEDIRRLEKKLQALHTFSASTSSLFSNSLNELKIAMQGVTVLSKTVVLSDGSYLLPEGMSIDWFNTLQTEEEINEWERMHGDIKEWNSLYKKFIKENANNFKSIWYGARVSRLSDGTLIVTTATGLSKKIDELTGFSKFVKENKNFTRIGSKFGELTEDGLKILKESKLSDFDMLTKGIAKRFKDSVKATLKATKSKVFSSITKPLTFGIKSLIEDAKSLKTAKGFGKVVPGLNLVSGMIDVGYGFKDSADLAKKDGLKDEQIIASQVGGMMVDVGKVAVTTSAATVAASVGAVAATAALGATAPVWVPVASAIAGSFVVVKGIEFVDKKYGITKILKKGVNAIIKGIGGWFK